jgi:hypothetical protein
VVGLEEVVAYVDGLVAPAMTAAST